MGSGLPTLAVPGGRTLGPRPLCDGSLFPSLSWHLSKTSLVQNFYTVLPLSRNLSGSLGRVQRRGKAPYGLAAVGRERGHGPCLGAVGLVAAPAPTRCADHLKTGFSK